MSVFLVAVLNHIDLKSKSGNNRGLETTEGSMQLVAMVPEVMRSKAQQGQ